MISHQPIYLTVIPLSTYKTFPKANIINTDIDLVHLLLCDPSSIFHNRKINDLKITEVENMGTVAHKYGNFP